MPRSDATINQATIYTATTPSCIHEKHACTDTPLIHTDVDHEITNKTQSLTTILFDLGHMGCTCTPGPPKHTGPPDDPTSRMISNSTVPSIKPATSTTDPHDLLRNWLEIASSAVPPPLEVQATLSHLFRPDTTLATIAIGDHRYPAGTISFIVYVFHNLISLT